MKFPLVLAALGLVLFGAGCAPTVSSPTPGGSTGAKYEQNYPAVGVASRFHHAVWSDGKADRCVYELVYPALEPSYAQSEEDYERWDAVNRAIQDVAFAGMVATTTANEYDIQSSAQRYLADCRNDVQDLIKELGEEETSYMSYVQSLGYTTELFQDGLLSLVIQSYSYTGGAHGLPWMTALTIDLPEGERLTLGDFVKTDSLKPFMQQVRRVLLDEWNDALFEAAKTELEGFVEDTSPLTDDQREAFSNLEDFYLTPTGFVFYWNVYDIAPYAAGQQTVFIPYGDVREHLIPDSRLHPLLP